MSLPVVDKPTHERSSLEFDITPRHSINARLARELYKYADLLEQQNADSFRVQAYRRAAKTVRGLTRAVDDILATEGRQGLIDIPTIGRGIASALAEMVMTGRWAQLERITGTQEPAVLFQTIPGVGPELAERFVDELHLETLEDLENAIHNPDTHIKGLGPGRKESIAAVIAARLGHLPQPIMGTVTKPSPELILRVDADYRRQAKAGSLPMIPLAQVHTSRMPRLPVLHSTHGEWHFTAMYSTTPRALRAGMSMDWVVIIYQAKNHSEGRCTVVTEYNGPQRGQRVIRGL